MSSQAVAFFLFALLFVPIPSARCEAADKTKETSTDIPPELKPKPITLHGKDITMAKALAEIARQTGNHVEDRRSLKSKPALALDLEKTSFWQALDAVARESDSRISFYERDRKLALIDGPQTTLPAGLISYNGIFRVAIKQIDAIHILEPQAHYCVIHLEVAWEPRFEPLLLETHPDGLVAQDDQGRALAVPEGGKGLAPVIQQRAAVIRVRTPAPPRSAQKLTLLKGSLSALGPSKMLTFTFDKLALIDKPADKQKQTKEGVSVTLFELRPEDQAGDQWVTGLLLEYPESGPKFESFQSRFGNNQIYLEKEKDGKTQRLNNNRGRETDSMTDTRAVFRYRFGDEPENNLHLDKFGDWKLVYRTPDKMIALPIPFEFKDILLP